LCSLWLAFASRLDQIYVAATQLSLIASTITIK
jgi:hypothetical protein